MTRICQKCLKSCDWEVIDDGFHHHYGYRQKLRVASECCKEDILEVWEDGTTTEADLDPEEELQRSAWDR